MMQRLWLLALACVPLGGCGTGIYSDAIGPDEYSIRGTSPGGMYGGFIGASPSPDAVKSAAERLCPSGYDKTYDNAGAFFEGKYIEWRIRCHTQTPS